MHSGRIVFSQVMDFLPMHSFRTCVHHYQGNRKIHHFSCFDQFLVMAFAQLTYRESLRDIETCLRALQPKLYHMGIRSRVARTTLAKANEVRDWRIYADFAQILIGRARRLYADEDFGKELGDGKLHDVNVLDLLLPEPGAYYVMDRGYLDFGRLHTLHRSQAFFVTRAKRNLRFRRRYSSEVDKSTGLQCDQTILLNTYATAKKYPEPLRRIRLLDLKTHKHLIFLTNQFDLPVLTIAKLYKMRWQIELFFKWIKQHLRIKAFYGTSENAVKTQIWIAISTYLTVAILKKELGLERSLYSDSPYRRSHKSVPAAMISDEAHGNVA